MNKMAIVLNSRLDEVCGCVYIEKSDVGSFAQVNIFNSNENGCMFRAIISDDDGCVAVKDFNDNYIMIKLPENFSIVGKVYVEISDTFRTIMNGASTIDDKFNVGVNRLLSFYDDGCDARQWAEMNGEENIYNEAKYYIDKFKLRKNLYSDFNFLKICERNFWDTIKNDIDFCFENFEQDETLSSGIKNSRWVKFENYSVGLLYENKLDYFDFDKTPKYVAIACKVYGVDNDNILELGSHSALIYLRNKGEYYRVLFQDAKTGKAVKIIRNKC